VLCVQFPSGFFVTKTEENNFDTIDIASGGCRKGRQFASYGDMPILDILRNTFYLF
jgi:hypothetical protein